MGIKYLNTICNKYASNTINNISLDSLKDSYIIIDVNIYIYKFKKMNELYSEFEIMLTKFKKYNISVLFIFDGKPLKDKENTINKRKMDIKKAENKLSTYKSTDNINLLQKYTRATIKVDKYDIDLVKRLIYKYDYQYIYATNEADELCAVMNKKYNYPVLTEDMDLFIYGTSIILKNPDFYNETLQIINTNDIINKLNILSFIDFQQICILGGTDYYKKKYIDLYVAFCFYKIFIETKKDYEDCSLFNWCLNNDIINKYEYNQFIYVFNKFNLSVQEKEQQLLT